MKAMKIAYASTPTAALQILNGIAPLDIEAHTSGQETDGIQTN